MMPMDELLAKIRERGGILNQKSDSLNVSIENLEAQLEGVGVEFWWNTKQVPDPADEDRGLDSFEDLRYYVLGYCKIGDRWRIATKKRTRGLTTGTRDLDEAMPLVKAPRAVRLEVARHLEDFFKALLIQMEAVHTKLDEALAAAKAPLMPKKKEGPKDDPGGRGVTRRGKAGH